MIRFKVLLFVIFGSLLLAACSSAACTEQSKAKFVADVKEIGFSWDAVEFNLAMGPEAKASQLAVLRSQTDRLYTPLCADYIKTLLIQSQEERLQNIGNYDNRPRPDTDFFTSSFKTFQSAPLSQLNGQVNLLTNTTGRIWLLFGIAGLIILVLLGFGAFFLLRTVRFRKPDLQGISHNLASSLPPAEDVKTALVSAPGHLRNGIEAIVDWFDRRRGPYRTKNKR